MHAVKSFLRKRTAFRAICLRGQSVGEFVLLIALVGLVIVFAGPQVSQAINNQFGSVTNTLKAGNRGGTTAGGGIPGGSGGSGGNVPDQEQIKYLESMKPVTEKDPRNWTLADQQLAAEDIAKRGTASVAFPKARSAMDAGVRWSIRLNNGSYMQYRIIGIFHDDRADVNSRAGLTFLADPHVYMSQMNSRPTNTGGWGNSLLRQNMNYGTVWNLMPAELQSRIKFVRKRTNNVDGGTHGTTVSMTADRLFVPSYSEIVPNSSWAGSYPWTANEGTQYEAFQGRVGNNSSNYLLALGSGWWLRTPAPSSIERYLSVDSTGNPSVAVPAQTSVSVAIAFCF